MISPYLSPLAPLGPLPQIVVSAYIALQKKKAERSQAAKTPTLFEGMREFTAGQTGVTYENTLIPHLQDSSELKLVDPYLRQHYQVRQLQEFLLALLEASTALETIEIVTTEMSPYEQRNGWTSFEQLSGFAEIADQLKERGVTLRFTFSNDIHDRSIETDEWTIALGRGLDMWSKPEGRFDQGQISQKFRRVGKDFNIIYLRNTPRN